MTATLKVYFLLVIGLTTSGFLAFTLLHPNNDQNPSVLHAVSNTTSPLYGKNQEQLHCVEFQLGILYDSSSVGTQRYNDIVSGLPFNVEEQPVKFFCLENNSGTGTLPPEPPHAAAENLHHDLPTAESR